MTATAPATKTFVTISFDSANARSTVAEKFDSVMTVLPADVVGTATPEEIAEAVFTATNAPFEVGGIAAVIRERFHSLAEHGFFFPSLSVGDTVTIGSILLGEVTLRVEPFGFSRI